MKYNIDYKPENRLMKPCEFLTEEKVTQIRENSREKKVFLVSREHKCLKSNKIITINFDCMNCDFYCNYAEVIAQQARRIKELEEKLGD